MEIIKRNINDIIDFGELKGQSFVEIFKFNYTYIEWIIRETEICFYDLDEFFKFGNPFDIKYPNLSNEAKDLLILNVTENNKLSLYNERRINFDNIKYLKDSGVLKYKNLLEIDYNFPEFIVNINKKKIDIINKKILKNKLK
jgi:hypothetical protein